MVRGVGSECLCIDINLDINVENQFGTVLSCVVIVVLCYVQ